MRNECTDKVTKFGGAGRRRFYAICEKPEGGGLIEPPPARNRVKCRLCYSDPSANLRKSYVKPAHSDVRCGLYMPGAKQGRRERLWPNGRAEPKGMFDKLAAVTFCCLGVLLLV